MIKSILTAAALVVGLAATPSLAATKPAPKPVAHHHHHWAHHHHHWAHHHHHWAHHHHWHHHHHGVVKHPMVKKVEKKA
jgi:hypothetical protein